MVIIEEPVRRRLNAAQNSDKNDQSWTS